MRPLRYPIWEPVVDGRPALARPRLGLGRRWALGVGPGHIMALDEEIEEGEARRLALPAGVALVVKIEVRGRRGDAGGVFWEKLGGGATGGWEAWCGTGGGRGRFDGPEEGRGVHERISVERRWGYGGGESVC